MPRYTQLPLEERNRISALLQLGKSLRQIAFALGRNTATISRELKRNIYLSQHSYRAIDAIRMALLRKKNRTYPCKVDYQKMRWIKSKLRMQWSPEQISARMKMDLDFSISHEWVYQMILKDKKSGGNLFKNLRRSHRKHKKRYGSSRRSKYPADKSIEKRPEIVAARQRMNDWEGDTIVGPKAKSGVVSIVERVTNLAKLAVAPQRHANSVRHAIIDLFSKQMDQNIHVNQNLPTRFSELSNVKSSI